MSDEEHGQQEALRGACSRVSADVAIDFGGDVRGAEDLRAEVERLREALEQITEFPDMTLRGRGDFWAENLHRARDLARAALGGAK